MKQIRVYISEHALETFKCIVYMHLYGYFKKSQQGKKEKNKWVFKMKSLKKNSR